MRNGYAARLITLGIFLALAGCNKTGTSSDSTNSAATAASSTANQPAPPPTAAPVVIDAGKTLAVTTDQEISTKTNNEGDHFGASLAEPVTADGNEVLPKGARVKGVITQAAEAGHVRGGAVITIRLDSISVNGQSYDIHTDSYTAEGKTRGKRTAIGAGGGAAFGAIVGALAGGGKGAAIGAAAGGGAGTAGAAATGDRDISIPAETRLHFKLTKSVTLSQ